MNFPPILIAIHCGKPVKTKQTDFTPFADYPLKRKEELPGNL